MVGSNILHLELFRLNCSLGLLATAIIKMDGVGGLAGWRWIFILEGIVTVFLSGVAAFLLPADISSAAFLTDEEKAFAREYFFRSHSWMMLIHRYFHSSTLPVWEPRSISCAYS